MFQYQKKLVIKVPFRIVYTQGFFVSIKSKGSQLESSSLNAKSLIEMLVEKIDPAVKEWKIIQDRDEDVLEQFSDLSD